MPEPLADIHAREDARVATAEQEAKEALALVDALEEKVRDGDESVTVEELANTRELGRFARLRAEAAERKARKAKEAARLAVCEELRTEIEQYATGAGAHFAELLKDAEDAVTAFVAAVDERNAHIRHWGERIRGLGVPEHHFPVSPPAEHGRLGHRGERHVIAGRRVLETLNANEWLSFMLYGVTVPSTGERVQIKAQDNGTDVYGRLAALDATMPDPSLDLVFFRGPNGSISHYDPDRVPSKDEIKRLGLVRVSRKEAWGE